MFRHIQGGNINYSNCIKVPFHYFSKDLHNLHSSSLPRLLRENRAQELPFKQTALRSLPALHRTASRHPSSRASELCAVDRTVCLSGPARRRRIAPRFAVEREISQPNRVRRSECPAVAREGERGGLSSMDGRLAPKKTIFIVDVRKTFRNVL